MLKKVLLSGFVVALAACSIGYDNCAESDNEYADYEYTQCDCGCENNQAVVEPVVTEVNPCNCAYIPDNTREILRPRLNVEVKKETKRNCPTDNQTLKCPCGECKTFENAQKVSEAEQQADENVKSVSDMPKVYELAAFKLFNQFIKDTTAIYSEKPNVLLYLKPTKLNDEQLPGGEKQGLVLLKEKILSSFTYAVTDDENNNDYYLETSADWFDTPSKKVPAIKYVATLYDNKNNKVGEWVEIVKKVENSEQWL